MSTTFSRTNAVGLRATIGRLINETPVTDIHTHLYAPAFRGLLLYGIDELLTYHYLIAEFFRASDMPYEQFWGMAKPQQAEAIWQTLFMDQVPCSEATRGVVTVLHRLGLDVGGRKLEEYRGWFNEQRPEDYVDHVLNVANLESAVMTNDPFDDQERPIWEAGYEHHPRLHAVLRIDPLLNNWAKSHTQLQAWGYNVDEACSANSLSQTRRFLDHWVRRMKALYMAVSLPPEFAFPEDSARAKLIEEAVLPVAQEHNIPFAMMIGVKRGVNPALRLGGDGVGLASLDPVEHLCREFQQNKFMVTLLSRENQHALCVTSRKFRNLLPFGCWWFLNNPSLIKEITEMRIEMLGPTTIPQHSDARVLEQVVYKWDHFREILAHTLRHKYADIVSTGWVLHEEEMQRDIARMLGGNFWSFLERKL